jgi:NAD(P)-dependent dehydrogenase (short-subunit alcohol dehydrogenase family)
MKKVIVVTGASSGFGALASRALANAGHAGELARWGVESTIVVPGAFTKGTNHFVRTPALRPIRRWRRNMTRGPMPDCRT